jgi:hypothetical protein
LRGEKKAMTNEEVAQVVIPKSLYVTKQKLCSQITKNPDLMAYFPDDVEDHCDRQFLLDVVNTLLPSYFHKVLDEIDSIRQIKGGAEPQEVEIDRGMMTMLRELSGPTSQRKNLRGLGSLRVGARKRKRPEFMATHDLQNAPSLATA